LVGNVPLHRTAVQIRALLRSNESLVERLREGQRPWISRVMHLHCQTRFRARVVVTADVWSFVLR
jgi:hypothetical protein